MRRKAGLLVGTSMAVHARSCSSAALLMQWTTAAPLQRCWAARRAGALTATASVDGHWVSALILTHLQHGRAAESASMCSQARFQLVL